MVKKTGPVVVCVINLKGGVGKSTIAALLARHALTARNLDVLAVDLDPQANLSQALMRDRYNRFLKDQEPSIVELFKGYRPPSAKSRSPSPLVASDVAVMVGQVGSNTLQIIPSRFDFSDNLIGAIRPDSTILARFLASEFKDKDLILIDCAPTESILTQAAYHASGYVLVPVRPEYFATIGFPLLQQSLKQFKRQNRGQNIDVVGVVINNAFYHGGNNGGPEKDRALQEIYTEAKLNNWRVYENEIPFSRGFPKLMRGDYSYPGNASRFHIFANEFFKSIGM